MSVRRHAALLVGLAGAVVAIASSASGGPVGLANCSGRQLRLSGHLTTVRKSLGGTLTIRNRTGRACALPAAPRRVSILIGRQLLPTLTVRLRGTQVPPGVSTRTLPARGRVALGVRWRNWCGAPRGPVRAVLVVTVFSSATPRLPLGTVTTPPCADARFSSRIAVSRFLARS
jgi:hypothetical protein